MGKLCTDGWRYLSETYRIFSYAAYDAPDSTAQEAAARAVSPKQRREQESERQRLEDGLVMQALRSLRTFGILLPSGAIAHWAHGLAFAPSQKGWKTPSVDLARGTIGSGTFWDHLTDEDPADHRLELERQYGIFLNCPMMVEAEEADRALKKVFPWHTTGFDLDTEHHAELVEAGRKLGSESRAGGRPKKGDAVIEKMVHQQFRDRLAPGGDLHSVKKHSVETAAIAWVKERTCGVYEPPHSTIRAYLQPLYILQEHGN